MNGWETIYLFLGVADLSLLGLVMVIWMSSRIAISVRKKP